MSLALAAPGGPEPACNATGQLTLEVARLANEAECPRAVAGDTPRQPSTDLEELYALAEPAKEDLDLVITSAAALSEGEPLTAPLKGLPRAQEKIAAE